MGEKFSFVIEKNDQNYFSDNSYKIGYVGLGTMGIRDGFFFSVGGCPGH